MNGTRIKIHAAPGGYTSHITNISSITSAGKSHTWHKCSPVIPWCFLQSALCEVSLLWESKKGNIKCVRARMGRIYHAGNSVPKPKSYRASLPLAFATWRKPPATNRDVRFSMDDLKENENTMNIQNSQLNHGPSRIIQVLSLLDVAEDIIPANLSNSGNVRRISNVAPLESKHPSPFWPRSSHMVIRFGF